MAKQIFRERAIKAYVDPDTRGPLLPLHPPTVTRLLVASTCLLGHPPIVGPAIHLIHVIHLIRRLTGRTGRRPDHLRVWPNHRPLHLAARLRDHRPLHLAVRLRAHRRRDHDRLGPLHRPPGLRGHDRLRPLHPTICPARQLGPRARERAPGRDHRAGQHHRRG